MTYNIKLPCGIDKNGNIVKIEDAVKGLACGCFCPGCKQPLVAKKGDNNAHHFAHKSQSFTCEHGYQSALHLLAKELFKEIEYLVFNKNGQIVKYKIDSVEVENRLDEIIPDLLITCDGKKFIVEIFVTHAVDEIKKQKIKYMRISAIEIDLSRFHKEMISSEELKTELCNPENISWLYDADLDYINDKKEVVEQFGTKRLIEFEAIHCPILVGKVTNALGNFGEYVPLDYCVHCTNCYWNGKTNYISCAYFLPFVLNNETRKKCYVDVFVNDSKVMFASELQEYQRNFTDKIQAAIRIQYNRFINIGRSLSAPSIPIVPTNSRQGYKKQRLNQHSNYHKKYR